MNQKGFTLVELIAYMMITAIVAGAIFTLFSSSMQSYRYSQKRNEEIQQAQTAINIISNDLKQATSIISPAKGATGAGSVSYITDSSYTVAVTDKVLMRNSNRLTANIVRNVAIDRDTTDGRLITITLTLNASEKDKSSGDYILKTSVFSPNATISK